VIITRTPLRISFAGGGSDLPAFFEEEPGMVLSAGIDKYMYVTVKKAFGEFYRISYSQTEIRERIDDIEHPIVRECLNAVPSAHGLEIVSIADIPAQAGMGSSSSFTVGLLAALYAMAGQVSSAENLASKACEIEIGRLREPIGKQDQYIAAYGGIQFMQFLPNGDVYVDPVICSQETRAELNRRLLLFFTGTTRETRTVLKRQNARTNVNRASLRELCGISKEMRQILTTGRDLNAFGRLLHTAWTVKRSLESTISNPQIDDCYNRAMEVGALGGKLLGAGGGGFLLFFCEPHCQRQLKSALGGLRHVPFCFEPQGSKVIYVGDEHWMNHLSSTRAGIGY
jgi:D-glycero-alpha-D-manno-heptose-7-phosphate kinase